MMTEKIPAKNQQLIVDVDMTNFMDAVLQASMQTPVILEFWAPWCNPCKQLMPLLEQEVTAAKGAVRLAKINIDKNQPIAMQMGVQSVPTVFVFVGGQPVDGFQGALPASEIKKFVAKYAQGGVDAGPSIDDLLSEAKTAIDEDNLGEALALYSHVLQQQPDNLKALAGLATCYVRAGDVDKAESLLKALPEAKRMDSVIMPVLTSIDLLRQSSAGGSVHDLKTKAEANPKDFQAQLDFATALFAQGQAQQAIDILLAAFARDKKWNDQALRKQLVKFFEVLGFDHPLSVDGRKRLSALLFA